MKKIFTLAAVLCAAISANAQTESWSVATETGELKPEYVANPDTQKASVVEFKTANVEGKHVSGPVAGYIDAETKPLEPRYDNSWGNLSKKDLSKDGSIAPFYYVQGKGNPVNLEKVTWEEVMTDGVPTGMYRAFWDDSYYNPDGTAGLPGNGTYVTLKVATDGTMKVNVWTNKGNRDIYVVKASDAKALAFCTEVKISGYINGQNNEVEEGSPLAGYPKFQNDIATKGTEGADAYIIGAGNQAAWVYLTWNAKAGETYYVFNKNTQMGFGGYEFTSTGGSAVNGIIADQLDENAPIYNIMGQRVSKDAKGILIQNGKKFINR